MSISYHKRPVLKGLRHFPALTQVNELAGAARRLTAQCNHDQVPVFTGPTAVVFANG